MSKCTLQSTKTYQSEKLHIATTAAEAWVDDHAQGMSLLWLRNCSMCRWTACNTYMPVPLARIRTLTISTMKKQLQDTGLPIVVMGNRCLRFDSGEGTCEKAILVSSKWNQPVSTLTFSKYVGLVASFLKAFIVGVTELNFSYLSNDKCGFSKHALACTSSRYLFIFIIYFLSFICIFINLFRMLFGAMPLLCKSFTFRDIWNCAFLYNWFSRW